jgi:hypothetical protein
MGENHRRLIHKDCRAATHPEILKKLKYISE